MTHRLSRWLLPVVIVLVPLAWWMLRGEPASGIFVGFGGGPPGGSFFPAAGAISTFVEQRLPDLNITSCRQTVATQISLPERAFVVCAASAPE